MASPIRDGGRVAALICLVLLASTVAVWAQEGYEGVYERINEPGSNPLDRINAALHKFGRIFLMIGAALLGLVALKLIGPFRVYYSAEEKLLKRAVRDVDDLLKRIQTEMETANEAPEEGPPEQGLLAGMTEVAEFDHVEHVPSYVFTVSDFALDNIGATLKRLRRFNDSTAERYQDYLFSVLKGIKTITEESAESGTASGLAVDVKEYFRDDRRYRVWRRLLSRSARKGAHQETASAFLVFMKDVRAGKPLVSSRPARVTPVETVASSGREASEIPDALNEETLPAIQHAAAQEAGHLCSLVRAGRPTDGAGAWQFEFVRRQQQVHHKDEAQQMLTVFLSCERKAFQRITKIRMLPCRTWAHVLHVLGAESREQLEERIDNRLLTIQEIIILEKAFLQTFAKKESLARVYGHGEKAGLMIDVHVPEIRRETLGLLQRLHRTEPKHLDDATDALNEEETPQNGKVRKLIAHYVHHGHGSSGPRNG